MELKSSGKIREFGTGAIRDAATDKPRLELLPDEVFERVAIWYALGAEKYGDNNYKFGIPESATDGSLLRHHSKWKRGMIDEDHLSAMFWNVCNLIILDMYHKDDEKLCDITGPKPWYDKEGRPTGYGSYKNRKEMEK